MSSKLKTFLFFTRLKLFARFYFRIAYRVSDLIAQVIIIPLSYSGRKDMGWYGFSVGHLMGWYILGIFHVGYPIPSYETHRPPLFIHISLRAESAEKTKCFVLIVGH